MFNIQPGNSSGAKKVRKSEPVHAGLDACFSLLARVMQTALLLLIVGAFFHTYIKLDQEINSTAAEIRRVDNMIVQVERETDGLRMEYANCSSRPFIERQIAAFKLPLKEMTQDQQRFIRVYTPEQLARMPRPVIRSRYASVDNSRIRQQ
jgi:hypothetical protein